VESKLVKGNSSDFTKFKVRLAKVYVFIHILYILLGTITYPLLPPNFLGFGFFGSKKGARRTNLSICCERIMGPPKKRLPNPGSDLKRIVFTKRFYRSNATSNF